MPATFDLLLYRGRQSTTQHSHLYLEHTYEMRDSIIQGREVLAYCSHHHVIYLIHHLWHTQRKIKELTQAWLGPTIVSPVPTGAYEGRETSRFSTFSSTSDCCPLCRPLQEIVWSCEEEGGWKKKMKRAARNYKVAVQASFLPASPRPKQLTICSNQHPPLLSNKVLTQPCALMPCQ